MFSTNKDQKCSAQLAPLIIGHLNVKIKLVFEGLSRADIIWIKASALAIAYA